MNYDVKYFGSISNTKSVKIIHVFSVAHRLFR